MNLNNSGDNCDPEQAIAKPSTFLKLRALIAAMLINILIGSYYVYGNINGYVAVFLNEDPSKTAFIQPLWLLIQGGGVVFSIRMCECFGYRFVNFWAFFVYILTNLACAWIKNIWLFFLTFGIVSGIAVGFGYLPALYIAWTYYPNNKSLVTGLILFWAGLSTLILAPLTTAIVNPDNLPVEKYYMLVDNVPKMWFTVSGLYTVIWVISASLQPNPWDAEEENEKLRVKMREARAGGKIVLNTTQKQPHQNIIVNKLSAEKKALAIKQKAQISGDNIEDKIQEPKKSLIGTITEDVEEENRVASSRRVANGVSFGSLARNSYKRISEADLVLSYDTRGMDQGSDASPTRWNRRSGEKSFPIIIGDECGFKMNMSADMDESDLEVIEAVEKKMLQADVGNILSEADIHMIGGLPIRRLPSLSASFQVRSQQQFSRALSKQFTGKSNSGSEQLDALRTALISMDFYKLSQTIISAECPSIYYGITSWHFWLMVSTVTTSLAFDYFINSVWKTYGSFEVGVPDSVITNAMIVASLCNAFVRVFVGQMLASVSYKKFY
jgi:hypothetical protein